MTTLLDNRLSPDAERLLEAVDALFPEDSDRVRGWIGRRIVEGDFAGLRQIDGKRIRKCAARWPDPLFRQTLEGAAKFMERGLLARFHAA